jgi:hypothetical protein
MAAFSFPSNPTDNQVYEAPNGVTYHLRDLQFMMETS